MKDLNRESIRTFESDLGEACQIIVALRWSAEGSATASLMKASNEMIDKLHGYQSLLRQLDMH